MPVESKRTILVIEDQEPDLITMQMYLKQALLQAGLPSDYFKIISCRDYREVLSLVGGLGHGLFAMTVDIKLAGSQKGTELLEKLDPSKNYPHVRILVNSVDPLLDVLPKQCDFMLKTDFPAKLAPLLLQWFQEGVVLPAVHQK